MKSFSINRIPRIVCESGISDSTGKKLLGLTQQHMNVLLIADPNLRKFGITSSIEKSLIQANHKVTLFEDIKSDPTEIQVQNAVEIGRNKRCNAVVCLGGGSTLDAGKLIANLLPIEDSIAVFRLAKKQLPQFRPSIIAIPTTAGTGSEATSVCVVSDSDGCKYWYWGANLKSDLVLLDSELTANLPKEISAASGIDAIVHAIEAETCKSRQNTNQIFTIETIRLGSKFLPKVVSDPSNSEARKNMLLAAFLGGVSIDNAGTGIAHNIAHALGSLLPIHHGRAVAIAMSTTIAWNIQGNEKKYEAVAANFGSENSTKLARDFNSFVRELGIDFRLESSGYNVSVEKLASQMAKPENESMRAANVRKMNDEDLPVLAKMVLEATT